MTRPKKTEHFCSECFQINFSKLKFEFIIIFFPFNFTAQVERTGVLVGRYATSGNKSVILAAATLETIFPAIGFLI